MISRRLAALTFVIAATHAVAGNDTETIKRTLQQRYSGQKIIDVRPTSVPGLYEVYTGESIVYSDRTGDHLLTGSLIETKTRRDLTVARFEQLSTIDFASLPFDRALTFVKGTGQRKLAVFSDPDCPFCQDLEKQLIGIDDVTVHVFLYPLANLHPEAPARALSIWCASDPRQAWSAWMLLRTAPAAAECDGSPIDELQKLGEQLHINSTPTVFLPDGRRIRGTLKANELEKLLATR